MSELSATQRQCEQAVRSRLESIEQQVVALAAGQPAGFRPSVAEELRDASLCASEWASSESDEDLAATPAGSPVVSPQPDPSALEIPVPAIETQSLGPAENSIFNSASGYLHRVLIGPPSLSASSWVTTCAWRFGASEHAVEPPPSSKACSKCFPHLGASHSGHILATAQDAPRCRPGIPTV